LNADEAAKPPERVGKARLVTLDQIDRRTKAAQLALEAKEAIIADLGGADQLSTLERLACEHAALASAVVADSYTRWLRGEQIALAELATVQNAFLRVAGSLGFSRRAKDLTATIDTYLDKENAPNEAAHSASKSS
jgi:hypothetical protein